MTKIRVWHPSRDPYHCAFRLIRLLLASAQQMLVFERLRVLDLFLLYPTLLHDMSMPKDVKSKFRDLHILRPDDIFMRLPGPAILAQDLRVYQSAAASQLAAKGILDTDRLRTGVAVLELKALPKAIHGKAMSKDNDHPGLLHFLTVELGEIPLTGREGLYRRAGITARDTLS